MIKTKAVRKKIKILDSIIDDYKKQTSLKKRDWKLYEKKVAERVKTAISFFEEYVETAIEKINFLKTTQAGRPEKLTLRERTLLLLVQRLMGNSNRDMAFMLILFSILTKIEISYKTIERLYEDERIDLILSNMHSLILKDKNINEINASGDGSGYVLSVKEHYSSIIQRIKDKKSTKKKKIIFSFALLDLETRLYVAFGTSCKSEQDAYNKSIIMLNETKVKIKSIRLDRYYSCQKYIRELGNGQKIKFYLIPKKNATIKGCKNWKMMLKDFIENTQNYLKEYYKRNQSESTFGEDKKRFGWKIPQKLQNRINLSYFAIFTWHNLLWVGG